MTGGTFDQARLRRLRDAQRIAERENAREVWLCIAIVCAFAFAGVITLWCLS